MSLAITEPEDACVGVNCTLDTGEPFTLAVKLVSVPAPGYFLAESYVEFGSQLAYIPAAQANEEMVWPDCTILTRTLPPEGVPYVDHACLTALLQPWPSSGYTGMFIELSFACSSVASTTDVFLFVRDAGLSAGAGTFFGASIGGETAQDNFVRPEVDGLTVNCLGEPGSTPTTTNTSEPGATDTPTPTATDTPSGATSVPTGTPTIDPNAPPTWTPYPTWTPEPTWTPNTGSSATPTPASPIGDVSCDGRVDPLDAVLVLQLVADLIVELPCPGVGDLSGDGVVDATDATLILQMSAGLIVAIAV
jgi:hypothetical protein